ncbi:SDR family oxidoreductase [Pediococcus siamensis]|uniref:SDR family oxidoreductase n=1 Tax=Pediococcus siamensis TaxID=381829 RepID=UPI00399F637C
MKIVLLGSLGHINRYVIPELVAAHEDVTVITSSVDRVAAIEQLGAQAAVGSMMDESFLTKQFKQADAVYLMITNMREPGLSLTELAVKQATIFKNAIQNSRVKRVVDLSSVGADQGPEVGNLYIYHLIEGILSELKQVELTFIRPVGFYSNLLGDIRTIKTQHALVRNFNARVTMAWTDPADIAKAVVAEILSEHPATVRYVVSEFITGQQLISQLAAALKLPDLHWIEASDDQILSNMIQNGVPETFAKGLVTMTKRQRSPEFYADLRKRQPKLGSVKLKDFMPTLIAAYQQA